MNESRSRAESPSDSVFIAALGGDAHRLRPEVRRYLSGPVGPGTVGVGEGVFGVAGSRFGRWNLLARPLLGSEMVVTRRERGVPFRVESRITRAPGGIELRSERVFRFRSGPQRVVDVLRVGHEPGILCDLLGASGRLELELRCDATGEGHLRLASRRAWVRAGRLRLRLPAWLSVRADVESGYDDASGRQTIATTIRSPLLGMLMEYRGSFEHRFEPADSSGREV